MYESQGEEASYCALSYCWGGGANLKTTSNNFRSHAVGIELATLPKTVRDAVILTRALGIQYLWVVAICIIQNSDQDFQQEAARMESIYSRATLTIAAHDVPNAAVGCFRSRQWKAPAILPVDVRLTRNSTHVRDIRMTDVLGRVGRVIVAPYAGRHPRSESVLTTRGWTLQEDLLSPRVLKCWEEQLSWKCLRVSCSETSPSQMRTASVSPSATSLQFTLIKGVDSSGLPLTESSICFHWQSLVEDYTSRKLTNASDKLTAFAGVQDQIAGLLSVTSVLSLWQGNHFTRSLLWVRHRLTLDYPDRDTPREPNGIKITCPSWSWASVDVPVSYRLLGTLTGDLLPEMISFNSNETRKNVHVTESVTLRCRILRARDMTVSICPIRNQG